MPRPNGAHAACAAVIPSVRDLEWAAGFLEGEGCFNAHKTRYKDRWYASHQVIASQVNREPLERLLRLFGGSVRPVPDKSDMARRRRAHFRWIVAGPRARGVMMTLFGLLSQRRRLQVKKALELNHRVD